MENNKPKLKTPEEIAALQAERRQMLLNPQSSAGAIKRVIPGELRALPPGCCLTWHDAEGKEQIEELVPPDGKGQYMTTFPAYLAEDQTAPSSTHKSLTATVRVDMGRGKEPIFIEHPEQPGEYVMREFGSFNMNLSLTPAVNK